ncbi:fluoride efflux transporter CrcB [Lewinella sp. W8]|uniref:fluoride efflux transporter CrcB n=1 Tax=Lewinella sp. W8 TaxID=2528208 RepID=UPI001067D4E0|nr:fluoride efflux transporter CrcB [Lewinella sp. W8]MTB51596.1 fluoride efflux transporter CrcB [Lewinella sp. W8]
MNWVLVFLGGGLGSLARYGLTFVFPAPVFRDGDFPWATLAANLLACIVLGAGMALAGREVLGKPAQLLLLTGFCGGFSTFSTFAGELLQLSQNGHALQAFGYLSLSLLSGVAGLWIAMALVR